ncbi:MAG: S8 family serine peptidase [Candidatus Heimdallarchaeota archaeon]|nr:S8 family serine peptidase [Candidatus Heimdallarchaeota archaeon]
MKTKIFAIIVMFSIVTPGFFLITPVQTKGVMNFLNPSELLSMPEDEFILAELDDFDTSDFDSEALYPIIPYWHDLVNKENVANDGEGVYIAVLDTGLLPNWQSFFPEDRIATEYGKGFSYDAWWDDDLQQVVFSDLKDDRGFLTEWASGHGTHVTSTILGFNFYDTYWIEGIAPKATIIPVLCLDAWVVPTPTGYYTTSGGSSEMIAAAIYYIADLAKNLDGRVIISMSLGGPAEFPLVEEAINYAIARNVIIVAAAGNRGNQLDWPGAYSQVISVAAGGWTEMVYRGWTADVPEQLNVPDVFGNNYQVYLETFSGRPNADLGQKHKDLDVMCIGAWVVGPYKGTYSSNENWGYYYVRGTSMATPHVSAIAALILELYPKFNQKDMEHILKIAAGGVGQNMLRGFPMIGVNVTVLDLGGVLAYHSWGRFDYGAGFLQADEAMFFAAHYKCGHHHCHCHCHH